MGVTLVHEGVLRLLVDSIRLRQVPRRFMRMLLASELIVGTDTVWILVERGPLLGRCRLSHL